MCNNLQVSYYVLTYKLVYVFYYILQVNYCVLTYKLANVNVYYLVGRLLVLIMH